MARPSKSAPGLTEARLCHTRCVRGRAFLLSEVTSTSVPDRTTRHPRRVNSQDIT